MIKANEPKHMTYQREAAKVGAEVFNNSPSGQFIPSTWQPPEGYTMEVIEFKGFTVEHLKPVVKTTNQVIFHVHGGGYVIALIDAYRESSIGYSNLLGGAEVFNVNYRVAPTHVYPAALEDAVTAYEWVLNQGYQAEQIVIMGDSAGGNLSLVTTLYLRDHQIPLPKAVIAISPWGDLRFISASRKENFNKDLILGEGGADIAVEAIHPQYLGQADVLQPYVSPIHADFKGFPKLLMQVGSHEILLDDSLELAQKAKAAGVDVTLTVYEGMSHDFQLLMPELEETVAAWAEMKAFLNKAFKA